MSALMQAEPIIPMSRAALASGISVSTIRRLAAIGRIPSVKVGGVRRVRLSQVLGCVEETVPGHFDDGDQGVAINDLFQPGVPSPA